MTTANAYTDNHHETELVVEPDIYRYLGVNRKMLWLNLPREGFMLLPGGALREAVTHAAVVDRVGQL